MTITAIATYQPVWADGRHRVTAFDEDVVTMAVATGRAVLGAGHRPVGRVIVVSRDSPVVDGLGIGVILRGLDLPAHTPIEFRIGGAPATLQAIADAGPGTVVIGVDLAGPGAAAGAVVIGPPDGEGIEIRVVDRSSGSLPMRVQHLGRPEPDVYDDLRVERSFASVPLISRDRPAAGDLLVAGLDGRDAVRLGAAKDSAPTTGAASTVFLLADLAENSRSARLVAIDQAIATAVDVQFGAATVRRMARPPVPSERRPRHLQPPVRIPFSMPAYARAFESKVGLLAARCRCGEVSFPPRRVCLECGECDTTELFPLPRTGEIYTVVDVHVSVPGVPGPYALAIVALDGVPLRVLARVADHPEGGVAIGTRGELVLRVVAEREGVMDYGYAFIPDLRSPDVGPLALGSEVAS